MRKGANGTQEGHLRDDTSMRRREEAASQNSPWACQFPMQADAFFNYPRLLQLSYANKTPLGRVRTPGSRRVAVIGGGLAGTQAMRELVRAGYHVHLYEASDRLGGRTMSWRVPGTCGGSPSPQLVAYEQGAMRIPFFNQHDPVVGGAGPHRGGPYQVPGTPFSDIKPTSLAELFVQQYAISTAAFPNPGKAGGHTWDPAARGSTKHLSFPGVGTCVYVNDGHGVDVEVLFPDLHLGHAERTFSYPWPADSPDAPRWPSSDPHVSFGMIGFWNHGARMSGIDVPDITLPHAIPYEPSPFAPGSASARVFHAGVSSLRTVAYKWTLFASAALWTFTGAPFGVGTQDDLIETFDRRQCTYGSAGWEVFWREKVMPHYQNVSFFDVAVAGPVLPERNVAGQWQAPVEWAGGNFGGLGMSGAEAQLFYTIGAGDGSWGAFFGNAALWALRALLFGFANQHQLILGVLNEDQTEVEPSLQPPPDMTSFIPYGADASARKTLRDSRGNAFHAPQYIGVGALCECHVFRPCLDDGQSLWDLASSGDERAAIFTSSKVTAIDRVAVPRDGDAAAASANHSAARTIRVTAGGETLEYDHVVMTIPIWNTQTDMTITGFQDAPAPPDMPNELGRLLLPTSVTMGLRLSHWIRSAKVFVALRAPYWKVGPEDTREGLLPQVLVTNSEMQDMYGLVVPTGDDPCPTTGGVALISYTWEDDAQKFGSFEQAELVAMLVERLEGVLKRAGLPSFKPFMLDETLETPGSYSVFHWSSQRHYHGCAKAYQPGIENMNYSLLTYNNTHARYSGLYFAGDSYSLESGWLEPALRLGVDAAVNIMEADGALHDGVAELAGFSYRTDYRTPRPLSMNEAQLTLPLGPSKTRDVSLIREAVRLSLSASDLSLGGVASSEATPRGTESTATASAEQLVAPGGGVFVLPTAALAGVGPSGNDAARSSNKQQKKQKKASSRSPVQEATPARSHVAAPLTDVSPWVVQQTPARPSITSATSAGTSHAPPVLSPRLEALAAPRVRPPQLPDQQKPANGYQRHAAAHGPATRSVHQPQQPTTGRPAHHLPAMPKIVSPAAAVTPRVPPPVPVHLLQGGASGNKRTSAARPVPGNAGNVRSVHVH